jgi:hypothetical protein
MPDWNLIGNTGGNLVEDLVDDQGANLRNNAMPPLPPSWNPYTVGLILIGAGMVLTVATAAADLAASTVVFLGVCWSGATLLIGQYVTPGGAASIEPPA